MRLNLSSVKNIAIISGPIALAAAIVLQSGTAYAQPATDTWKDGVTGVWSNGTNWIGNVAPASGITNSLFFNNASGSAAYTATNDLANPFNLNLLTLNNSNATGGAGLITLSGSQIGFNGTNPTLNFNGTGDAAINSQLLFNATSVIGGTGSGVLTIAGTINTATTQATNLSVNNPNGTVNFTGTVNLKPSGTPATDQTGGSFFATNGTVNINNGANVFTANNLFYVGDSISSITNFTTGAGTTGTNANATLNIVSGNQVQNGRLAIGAFTGDKGTLTLASGASLQVRNGLDPGSSGGYFGGRLQLGGYGGTFDTNSNQVYGTANATAGAANLVLTGGQLSVVSAIEMYTNGKITATNGSIIHTAAVADGNLPAGGVGGISLTNSNLFFDGAPSGTVVYSGNITGSGSTITKQDNYTQVLAGSNTMTGTISANGGILAITGNTATNINVLGENKVDAQPTTQVQTGTLNVTGTAGGIITVDKGSQNTTGGNLSGTGTVGAIVLRAGTLSPGGTATTATGVGAVGTLNGTSLSWSSAASMRFDLNLASNASGDDLLNLSSFFNRDTSTASAGAYAFNFTTSGTFSGVPTTYNLVDYQTGQRNFLASDFSATGIPTGLLGVFSFNGANNILQFTISGSAMPEPSALPFALAGLAPIGFVAFRRVRRQSASASLHA